ncbi:unnamed protein product [Orchesella dallaii]|uniref:Uncharacterized protein n=1 Tax=Orchesella dallaii TaxID=48710 RepID=A0ABP1QLQ2_9HEXA
MAGFRIETYCFVVLMFSSYLVNTLHLDNSQFQPQPWRSLNPPENTTVSSQNVLQRDPPNLNSIIPDPTAISTQIQSAFQSFLQQLNSTFSSSPIFTSLRNLTSSLGVGGFRLEDADLVLRNVSEVLRSSEMELEEAMNSSGIHGALRDFKEVVTRLRSSLLSPSLPLTSQVSAPVNADRRGDNGINNLETNAPTPTLKNRNNPNISSSVQKDGMRLRRMWDQLSTFQAQIDSTIQDTISNARSNVEESLSVARQQGTQFMKNQTNGIMNEIRRAFKVFTEPFKKFFDDMRGKFPTAVVTA